MSPLTGARVVHPRWAEHHEVVAHGTWQATGTITDASAADGGWTLDGGPTEGPDVAPLYDGAMNVTYEATQPTTPEAAGQVTTETTVTVTIPRDAPAVPDGSIVVVTAVTGNGDPRLVGRRLVVQKSAPQAASLERLLTCVDDSGNQGGD